MKLFNILKNVLLMRILSKEEIKKIKEIGSKYGEVEETKNWIIIHPTRGGKKYLFTAREEMIKELKDKGIDVPIGFGYRYRELVIPKEIKPTTIEVTYSKNAPYFVAVCVEDGYKVKDELRNRGFYFTGRMWCIDVDPDPNIVNETIKELEELMKEKGVEYEVNLRNLDDVLGYALKEKKAYEKAKEKLIEKLAEQNAVTTIEALENGEIYATDIAGTRLKPKYFLPRERWLTINRELRRLGYRWDNILREWKLRR